MWETQALDRQFEGMLGKKVADEMVEPWTWARAERGWKASGADFAATKAYFNQTTRSLGRFFQKYDILLTPTLGTVPPRLEVHDTRKPFEKLWPVHFDFIPFTLLHNIAGTPAVSVPLYWTTDERPLPVGVQFAARYANEAVLFRLAGQLERARPWKDRRPTLKDLSVLPEPR